MFGGAVVINGDEVEKRVGKLVRTVPYAGFFWTAKILGHQIIFYLVRPFYDFLNIGKFILLILAKLKLVSREVEEIEKKGSMVDKMIQRMPNALCFLAFYQLAKLKSFTKKRKEIGKYYQAKLDKDKYKFSRIEASYLRFPVETINKQEVLRVAWNNGIYLGDWYSQVVAPEGVSLPKMDYKRGSCPVAERKNKLIINLPTNPNLTKKEINKVIELFDELASKRN